MNSPVQRFGLCIVALLIGLTGLPSPGHADVQPGDTITKDNMSQAETLLIPSTRWMVERGMPIQVIPTKKVTWPKVYEDATEKFAAQVEIADDGRQIFNLRPVQRISITPILLAIAPTLCSPLVRS